MSSHAPHANKDPEALAARTHPRACHGRQRKIEQLEKAHDDVAVAVDLALGSREGQR